MSQSSWLVAFLTALSFFLTSFCTYLLDHKGPITDKETLLHIGIIFASSLTAMISALKYQLRRQPGDYTDRVSDRKLNEINNESEDE